MPFEPIPFGLPIPLDDHAIAVSLPTWDHTVKYKHRDAATLAAMQTSYPRFFVHRKVEEVNNICEKQFGQLSERCLAFVSPLKGEVGREFLAKRGIPSRVVNLHVRDVQFGVVFVDASAYLTLRLYWQHAGWNISSRLAEHVLGILQESPSALHRIESNDQPLSRTEGDLAGDQAKDTIRKRIASFLSGHRTQASPLILDGDIFLYPSGMAAIWTAHDTCLKALGDRPTVCFGFPYTDTYKVLLNWGNGPCHFFPDGDEKFIDELESLLEAEVTKCPTTRPVLSLFTELPSNPLLRSVNLPRLRQLADKYDFVIVIDETVGNFVNVDVLPYADILTTSLTKLFSGAANVMGGSIVLNPRGKHYTTLRSHLQNTFEDVWFHADAIVMDKNSRDFASRTRIIDDNTLAAAQLFHSSLLILKVCYPYYETKELHESCRKPGAGYGGLVSLIFKSVAASKTFYDRLTCAKGPTFGTNFTMACFYTILGHYHELEWVESLGVDAYLVRISVGMEDQEMILGMFKEALRAAEAVADLNPMSSRILNPSDH